MIAAAGSQAKLDAVKKYAGADYLIDYTKPGWQKEVLKITGGHGVDVVYDPVGLIQGLSFAAYFNEDRDLQFPVDRVAEMHCLEGEGSCRGFRGRENRKGPPLPENSWALHLPFHSFR